MSVMVNFDSIHGDDRFWPIVKTTLKKIEKQQYLSIGEFLKSLTDEQLEFIGTSSLELSQSPDTPTSDLIGKNLIVLSTALAAADGALTEDEDECHQHLEYFIAAIAFEGAYRNGIIALSHEKMSFLDPDAMVAFLPEDPKEL